MQSHVCLVKQAESSLVMPERLYQRGGENVGDEDRLRAVWWCTARELHQSDDLLFRVHFLQNVLDRRARRRLPELRRRIGAPSNPFTERSVSRQRDPSSPPIEIVPASACGEWTQRLLVNVPPCSYRRRTSDVGLITYVAEISQSPITAQVTLLVPCSD
jgi:hypothetical protein